MADIFVSYARPDRPRAEQLARALERAGWSVWWDREIPPGRSFDEVIEEALSLARCVIVLWSQDSVRSEWVKTEAAEAAQRRILVPILADGARIPLEFRRIQAAAIDDWRNLESNAGWVQLCDAVAALADSARRVPPARAITPVRRSRLPWAITGVTLALGVGAAGYLAARPASNVAGPTTRSDPAPPPAAVAQPVAPVAATPAPKALPEAEEKPARPRLQRRLALGGAKAPSYERGAAGPPSDRVVEERPASPSTAPAPLIETTVATRDVARRIDREPPAESASSFDVTLISGVFRDRGRLSVAADGIRFHDTGGSGRTLELPCGALRRVATATMIADREQRLLELTASERGYRVLAGDTGARDSIRAAIGRTCAR
jgi:hypothetical protein